MRHIQPPHSGVRPFFDQSCDRLMPHGYCGKPASHRVAWSRKMDNTVLCEEHFDETRASWVFYDLHPLSPVRTGPNTKWAFSWANPPGGCIWVVSDETMAALEGMPGTEE